jgi:uncharacterized membrane protein
MPSVKPMAAAKRSKDILFKDKTGLDRLAFFSDAVMAIAITLLVIDLRVPEMARSAAASGLGPALLKLWPGFLGYLLSFFFIGNYWLSHHRFFRPVVRYDDRLALLNTAFLFFIALLPFSTRLIGLYPGTRTAVLVYSLNVLPLGFITYALTRHAYLGHRLVETAFGTEEIDKHLVFARRGMAVFLLCLIVSVAWPVTFFPVWFLSFVSRTIGRRVWKVR